MIMAMLAISMPQRYVMLCYDHVYLSEDVLQRQNIEVAISIWFSRRVRCPFGLLPFHTCVCTQIHTVI